MHHRSDDELPLSVSTDATHKQLAARRRRCMKAAKALAASGLAGAVFLCVWGLRPAAVGIPVFLVTTSLLLASVTAALFARVADLQTGDDDEDSDDDGRGPGRGPDPTFEPPSGGGAEFDWEAFERDFRAYAQRGPAVPA